MDGLCGGRDVCRASFLPVPHLLDEEGACQAAQLAGAHEAHAEAYAPEELPLPKHKPACVVGENVRTGGT